MRRDKEKGCGKANCNVENLNGRGEEIINYRRCHWLSVKRRGNLAQCLDISRGKLGLGCISKRWSCRSSWGLWLFWFFLCGLLSGGQKRWNPFYRSADKSAFRGGVFVLLAASAEDHLRRRSGALQLKWKSGFVFGRVHSLMKAVRLRLANRSVEVMY
mgnify:CR=1 FL=1